MIKRFRTALLGLTAALLAATVLAVPARRPPNLPTPPVVLYYLNDPAILKPGAAAKLKTLGVTDVSFILGGNSPNAYAPGLDRDLVRARCELFAAAAKPLRWHVAVRSHGNLSTDKKFAPLSASGWGDTSIWDWWVPNLVVIAEETQRAGGTGIVWDDEPYVSKSAPWSATTSDVRNWVPKRAKQFLSAWKGLQVRHCAPFGKVAKLAAWAPFWREVQRGQPAVVFLAEETYVHAHNPPQVLKWRDQIKASLGSTARISFGLSPTQPRYAADRERQRWIKQATPGAGLWLYSFPHSAVEPLTEDPKSAPVAAAIRAVVGR